MNVIAFTGKKGVGKNFVADITKSILEKQGNKVEFAAFADPMKRFLIDIVGLDAVKIYGNDKDKNSPTGYKWEKMPCWLQQKFDISNGDVTIRHALQIFGTELNREIWDSEIWVKAMQRRIITSAADWLLITDCRYQNEIDSIKTLGGKVWKVDGIQRGDEFAKNDAHSSEKVMDNTVHFDYTIFNGQEDTALTLEYKVREGLHCYFFGNTKLNGAV
jgi:hypothetical protein